MNIKGINFKPESIQAIIEGRKTQTRRVIKLKGYSQDIWNECVPHNGKVAELLGEPYLKVPYDPITDRSGARITAHYGIGETVYVKEAWAAPKSLDEMSVKAISELATIWYKDGTVRRAAIDLTGRGKWRSPMIMPERFARYFITITDVRAERLGNMISGDCLAEGITASDEDGIGQQGIKLDYKFKHLWNFIKKDYPWESNPWDFAYTFKQEMK